MIICSPIINILNKSIKNFRYNKSIIFRMLPLIMCTARIWISFIFIVICANFFLKFLYMHIYILFIQTKPLSIDTLKSLVQCVSCKRSNIGVRSLPCWHVLCQECLEQALKSFDAGNDLICPLCYAKHPAKLFEEGVYFPFSSNFIEKLRNALEFDNMGNVVDVGRLQCQVCENNFQEDMTIPHSAVSEPSDWDSGTHACDRLAFCVQCSQNMCRTCARKHTSMSASKSHRVYTYGDRVNIGDWMKSSESNVQKCGKHNGREIMMKCEDCINTGSQWGCLLCFKEHDNHQGLLVKNVICVQEVRQTSRRLQSSIRKSPDDSPKS